MRIQLVNQPSPVTGDVRSLDPAERAARADRPVALVTMPFVSADSPSLQLGLLKPIAESHGFPAETFHLNLELAATIGPDVYEPLWQHRGPMLGDWLFSKTAFGDAAPDPDGQLLDQLDPSQLWGLNQAGADRERLRHMRDVEIPRYIQRMVDLTDWSRFAVVGFTSTFQQNVASFSLAAALKRRWPEITTLFGGANFDGAMGVELVRSIGAIDLAITGEADITFSQLLVALTHAQDPASVPGVLSCRAGEVVSGGTPAPVEQLDELPTPSYAEYFERAERLGILRSGSRRLVKLPYESARGCWWGAKRHCTFCGLNGSTMAFRAKRPARVADELAQLAERHRTFGFAAVDNIVEPSYVETLFPALVSAGSTYDLFYEVKANLSREQLRVMRAAGVRHIQPGIESLSSRVLGLMRKGTRASTNINLLRWARHFRIHVSWNLLWGFPGESEEDYRQQADLMRSLHHLQPPGGGGRIWMERFSPIFEDRATFPAGRVEPNWSYRHIYPSNVNLADVAYFFDHDLLGTLPDQAYEETDHAVRDWARAWVGEATPVLELWQSPGIVQIDDTREPARPCTHTFRGALASLYLACFDRPRKAVDAAAEAGVSYSPAAVEAALDEFVSRKLMMRDGNLFLALALPASGAFGDLDSGGSGVTDRIA